MKCPLNNSQRIAYTLKGICVEHTHLSKKLLLNEWPIAFLFIPCV